MRNKQVYNPYMLEENKQKDFRRLMLLSTVGVSLLGSLLFFPLSQILTANGAASAWKYLVYYISEILSVGALFSVLALFTIAVAHEEHTLRKKTMLWELLTLVFISFALRIFLYWFTAFLDKQLMLDFYFNDKTLDHLTRGGALISFIMSSLLNLPVLLLVLFVSLYSVRVCYQKSSVRGEAVPMMKKIPVVVYLAVAVLFAAVETGFTVAELGFSLSFQVVTTILMPYIEIALFSLFGYYLLSYLVDAFDKK